MIKGTAVPQANHIPWLDISGPRYWVAVMCVNPGKASGSAPSTFEPPHINGYRPTVRMPRRIGRPVIEADMRRIVNSEFPGRSVSCLASRVVYGWTMTGSPTWTTS